MYPKLQLTQIKSLALEGGGGKGFAFIGALQALERLKILTFQDHRVVGQITGFSGSSAGAITALFLSCGYSPSSISMILEDVDFSALFDNLQSGRKISASGSERQGYQPSVGTEREPETHASDSANYVNTIIELLAQYEDIKRKAPDFRSAAALGIGMPTAVGFTAVSVLLWLLSAYLLKESTIVTGQALNLGPPYQQLTRDLDVTLDCLIRDWGFFCGDKFLDAFGRVIAGAKTYKTQHHLNDEQLNFKWIADESERNPIKPDLKLTFKEHKSIFKTNLGVMASNLSTRKSVFFSAQTTPNFSVALAVRISMSLPIVFKPVVLKYDVEPPPEAEMLPSGVYVDGGLFNNVPLTITDTVWGGGRPSTLALRLEEETPADIRDLRGYLKAWIVDVGAFGSGESQIHKMLGTEDRTILLKTDGLDLLNFAKPRQQLAEQLEYDACKRVCEYFGGRDLAKFCKR